jgi:acyl-CoA dehydrogenase
MTLFYIDLDRSAIEVREIPKMGREAVDSNLLFIDKLKVPVADRIGVEGRGFHYILHGKSPERILIAAEAVGLGRAPLDRAARYAKERVVFGRPIGQNQAIQHPSPSAGSSSTERISGSIPLGSPTLRQPRTTDCVRGYGWRLSYQQLIS